jgi:uncharacterized protein (TIGR03000 family)
LSFGCSCWGGYCSGCWGGYGCYAGCWGCSGAAASGAPSGGPPDPAITPKSAEERAAIEKALKDLREKKNGGGGEIRFRSAGSLVSVSPRTARVTVQLPADARLFIDNQPCPLTSSTRTFSTPALQPGREYYYTLRAELTRNGERRVQTQRVLVSAGRQVRVEFNNFSKSRQLVQR